jgi:hypothetical protein
MLRPRETSGVFGDIRPGGAGSSSLGGDAGVAEDSPPNSLSMMSFCISNTSMSGEFDWKYIKSLNFDIFLTIIIIDFSTIEKKYEQGNDLHLALGIVQMSY